MCGWEEKADRFKSEKNLDNFIGHRQDFGQCLLFCCLFFFFLEVGDVTPHQDPLPMVIRFHVTQVR